MQDSLGSYLRQIRCARHLTQAQVARRSGIGRVTLNRWEKGEQQPHKQTLEILLKALSTSLEEQQQACSLLSAPSRRPETHALIVRLGEPSGIGPMPHVGAFLQALRVRYGLSQEEAAQRLGVTERTLRRWEKSEIQPSSAQIQALCYTLGARTEEMLALTAGHLPSVSETTAQNTSLDDIKEQAKALFSDITPARRKSLKDLGFFVLEVQAWPLALQSEAGRRLLSQVYGYHAAYLSSYQRWSESGLYANRSLDLLSGTEAPDTIRILAALAAARVMVFRGSHPAPKRGVDMLRHWVNLAQDPAYKAWILSDLAEYIALSGDTETGLPLSQQAREIAAECENRFERYHRELAEARMLIGAGKIEGALLLTARNLNTLPAQSRIVEAEGFLAQATLDRAQERLQEAWKLIEMRDLDHLRPQAQKLERGLSDFS